jgi:hypothetical protein
MDKKDKPQNNSGNKNIMSNKDNENNKELGKEQQKNEGDGDTMSSISMPVKTILRVDPEKKEDFIKLSQDKTPINSVLNKLKRLKGNRHK